MATEVKVPTLGELITEGTLAQWLKKPGEAVEGGRADRQPRDRQGRVEVPSPVAGVLGEQQVKEGDKVAVGAVIARIDRTRPPGAAALQAPRRRPRRRRPTPRRRRESGATRRQRSASRQSRRAAARCLDHDPVARGAPRGARNHVDPTKIRGTGKDGRLTKEDVVAAAQGEEEPRPARPGPGAAAKRRLRPQPARRRPRLRGDRRAREERVKMTRLRQTIATRLKEAQNTAAMLTTFNDVDMTRGDRGARPLQGPVREEARHPPRLHGLLREGLRARR